MNTKKNPLPAAIRLAVGVSLAAGSGAGLAQDGQTDQSSTRYAIEEIEVRALGVREQSGKIAFPFSIIDGRQLIQEGAGTLGDALAGQPGVHSDTFGGGASRPVIRGQAAPRVTVLSDGASVLDASGTSPDHAIAVDALSARKIEVLRGPATLLYGSGAIGGVVNVVDNKIPSVVPENAIEGMFALRGNTVADERAAAVGLTARASDKLIFHVEGSHREADDYDVPGWDESQVPGTWAESQNSSAGVSWVGDDGYIGIAYSYRHDEYGLPGHSHEYEDCHPHGSSLHCGGHGHEHEHEHEHGHDHVHHDVPFVDLVSRRVDLRGDFNNPFAGVEQIRLRASHTDYRHHEIEGSEIGTAFTNDGYEARVEIQHAPLADWTGVVGLQYINTDQGAVGAEAFVPDTEAETMAIFLVEHRELNEHWHVELGVRHERQDLKPVNDLLNRPAIDDNATSFSGAAIWSFLPEYSLTLSAAHSERLAQPQELYARGIHLGTNTYECGLAPFPSNCGGAANGEDMAKETSRNVEVRLRGITGDLTFSVGAFHNQVDNYVYAMTLDRHEDFRLIKYTQRDAVFTGIEAEASYQLSSQWSAILFGDMVRAEFDEGGNLPRISPARYGMKLNGTYGAMDGELEYYRVAEQDDIADYEEVTPGYNMLNLTVSYAIDADERYSLFLRGSNLLDEEILNHTSFLAHAVPLPGRNIGAGVTARF